jgi:peptide/nickel transport system substrate-binding protein
VLTFVKAGQCNLFCSKNIPAPANDNSGQNWTRTNVPELDPLLETIDTSLDEAEQQEAGAEADRIQAENMVSLPLDPLPNILIWSNDVVGPIGDNPVLGPFQNSHEWGVTS